MRRPHGADRGPGVSDRFDMNRARGPGGDRLRLLAAGEDDLQVLSALLQDAIIPGEDMHFDSGGRRFVMVANRFCWDLPPVEGVTSESGGPVYRRRLCGLRIAGVQSVRQSGMPADRRAALLNLLAMTSAPGEDGATALTMLFSGGAALRLTVDALQVIAEDIAAGQPTPNRPRHQTDG